jgi:WD40 repeat protein
MAMEIRRCIGDAHDQAILSVTYNPQRREIFTGSQDTTIKVWLSETGELLRVLSEHAGWVTGLTFASEVRMLFSCSIDGRILVWSFKGELLQKEKVGGGKDETGKERSLGGPLYCLAWDARRHNLVAGANGHIWVYSVVVEHLDLNSREKPIIRLHSRLPDAHSARGLEEPVRGVITTESGKMFSVGYDRSLCIWDTDHLAHTGLKEGARSKKKKGVADTAAPSFGDSSMLQRKERRENCHEVAFPFFCRRCAACPLVHKATRHPVV